MNVEKPILWFPTNKMYLPWTSKTPVLDFLCKKKYNSNLKLSFQDFALYLIKNRKFAE